MIHQTFKVVTVGTITLLIASLGCEGKKASPQVVATVNGLPITVAEFQMEVNRRSYVPGQNVADPKRRKELLDEMIRQELLFQKAIKAPEFFRSSERLRKDIAREYLNFAVNNPPFEPKEEDVKAYYEENKEGMERVRVTHILFKPRNSKGWDEAKQRAEKTLSKLKAEGKDADLSMLAHQFSDDADTKLKGGDLGFITAGQKPKELTKAAFELKALKEVSGLIKTEKGYHILQLNSEERGFDRFRYAIAWKMTQERKNQKMTQLTQNLNNAAQIQVFSDPLSKIVPEKKVSTPPAHSTP